MLKIEEIILKHLKHFNSASLIWCGFSCVYPPAIQSPAIYGLKINKHEFLENEQFGFEKAPMMFQLIV